MMSALGIRFAMTKREKLLSEGGKMQCWKCGGDIEVTQGKISFREVCDHCNAYLHCCRNCQFYRPGMANDCAIPDTEFVADREAANFCEDFKPLGKQVGKAVKASDVSKKLFKD